ncbi:MAG: bifunctional phosphoribosylaminoimidazolecarboxamide formyltransferase/IMP cyclohydrolase [Thermoplasmatota archaeon]
MTPNSEKIALISVSDKRGLDVFARDLLNSGYSIKSTGGTYRYLADHGINCTRVESVTGFPEILDGRVKTLHPKIFGGILYIRNDEKHLSQTSSHGIGSIDLVVVNLYPFEETIARETATFEESIEQIDIGGPSLIRAAAKNHNHVGVVVDPGDYGWISGKLISGDGLDAQDRMRLALKAFSQTSSYDIAIQKWLGGKTFPEDPWTDSLRLRYERFKEIRYGENPHQKGAYFSEPGYKGVSVANSDILWGKELSYNNIYDIDAVLDILMEFPDDTCCAIIKHNNPSGVAIGKPESESPIADAFTKALGCDPLSAFGGIIGLNRECDANTAEEINKRFFEVVIAPSFSGESLEILKRKKNLRIIRTKQPIVDRSPVENKWVKVRGGALIQTMSWPPADPSNWNVVTKKKPTEEQIRDMVFASKVVKHVKSNCVALAKGLKTVGIGAGQMSRVDSCFMAAKKSEGQSVGSVMSSDAFFPFRDGIDTSAEAGVLAIAQPGGSIRDEEVINAADEHGMAMVFTGVRLFKH